MNERTISVLRSEREMVQMVAEPIDWVGRMLNNKRGYPPLWIRQKVGDLSDFEGSGGEYISYLKLLGGLEPGDRLLDIGCGCGLICLDVTEQGSILKYLGNSGRYVGVDIDGELIRWCNRNIGKRYPTSQFKLVPSNFYTSPSDYLASYTFNVILCKSLFTHLLLEEVEGYLELVRDRLVSGGRCLSTWFLLKGKELTGRYTFKYREGNVGYERETNKRLAVAYKERWLLGKLKGMGFSIQVWYGSWRGTGGGLSFQDIIIMRKI